MKRFILAITLMCATFYSFSYPSTRIFHGDRSFKKIALTFDDGPNPDYTPNILNILKTHNIKATFFVVGISCQYFPESLKHIHQEGHELANHSYTHTRFDTLTATQMKEELTTTNDLVKQLTGIQMKFFRPPGGRYNRIVIDTVATINMKLAFWDVNSGDYKHEQPSHTILPYPYAKNIYQRPAKELTHIVLSKVKNGSIILFHNTNGETLKSLPVIIESLVSSGYQLVTLSELLQ